MRKKLNPTTVGYKIRKSRKEIGLSQKDLASELKVSDKTISSYEVGRATPSFETIKKISKTVHKPLAYFDDLANTDELDMQIKIKTIEKELLDIKRMLRRRNKK